MKERESREGRGAEARIRVAFRVPLDFAFAWCTDYTPQDGALEGESYERKIVERTRRRVVFEDLEETESGWVWSRDVVTLRSPDRWHMEGVGNRRDVAAEYVLSRLPDDRTQLELRWRSGKRRRPARGSGSGPRWNGTIDERALGDDARSNGSSRRPGGTGRGRQSATS